MGRTLGVVAGARTVPAGWPAAELQILAVFANLAGLALGRPAAEVPTAGTLLDTVTGLAGGSILRDRLGQAVLAAGRAKREFAVLALNIAGFSAINEEFGRDFGDAVLAQVGQRLASGLRASDTVARTGSDQFVAILPGAGAPDQAQTTTQKLLWRMSQRYDVQGNALDIGVRAGVALFPRHGREPDTLLKASERAVLEAKIQQSEYVLFDPSWE